MSPRASTTLMALLLLALASQATAQARVFSVTTTNDTQDALPGDGLCGDANGSCSLRAAVTEANSGTSAAGDRIDLPAGLYTLTLGNLAITTSQSIVGAGSGLTIIDGNNDTRGVFEFGQVVYAKKLFQGLNTVTGQLIARAVPTQTDAFVNCLAAQGCMGKPGLVDVGGSDPIAPIAFDFALSPAEGAAVAQASGVGLLTVEGARDIGHKLSVTPTGVADVVPATVDGVPVGELFYGTIDSCPAVENFAPINFDCGPNFHDDTIASSSSFVGEADFKTAAQDGSVRVLLSPTTGPGNAGVGRLKIFSVNLLYLKRPHVTLRGLSVQRGSSPTVRTATIYNKGAIVETFDFVVKDSFGAVGGAIWNDIGTMTLHDSTIANNTAYIGGGIVNGSNAILTLHRSTVSGNMADLQSGGGIFNSGQLFLTNATISGNLARLGGGGVSNTGSIEADFSTIADNSANFDLSKAFDPEAVGGGIANLCRPGVCGYVSMGNSLLAGNRDGRDTGLPSPPELYSPDCFSPGDAAAPSSFTFRFRSSRNNLVGVVPAKAGPGVVNLICDLRDLDTVVSDDTPYDLVGRPGNPVDPALEPLADNGGWTRTHALPLGSPAINAVTVEPGTRNCPATDQRGFRRPGDAGGDTVCDSGAYEAGSQTAIPEDPATRTSPVSITFANITQPGVTRLEILSVGPATPVGFMLGNPPTYYEISSSTTFTPPVTICIDYSGTSLAGSAMPRLLHYEDTNGDGTADAWVDKTVSFDTARMVVCAAVDSFSPFAVFERINRPPQANAGPDRRVECDSSAPVTLDGSASSDPDGDVLRYEWRNGAGVVVGTTHTVSLVLPAGANAFTLTVTDPGGLKSTDGVVFTVRDTSRPVIQGVTASPDTLWPPNGTMVPVTVNVSVADRCDAGTTCRIVSVTSNEPCSGHGPRPDWEIVGDLTVNLRAERAGSGRGRVYTITVECRDASGNRTRGTVAVKVPHDRR